MTQGFMQPDPEQLDFWPNNIIQVNFKERYAYELSPPLTNSDRIIYEWIAASERQRLRRRERYQTWKASLYSIRILTPQIRLKVYKKNGEIIVERIPYRGYALREQMKIRNMRVIK